MNTFNRDTNTFNSVLAMLGHIAGFDKTLIQPVLL